MRVGAALAIGCPAVVWRCHSLRIKTLRLHPLAAERRPERRFRLTTPGLSPAALRCRGTARERLPPAPRESYKSAAPRLRAGARPRTPIADEAGTPWELAQRGGFVANRSQSFVLMEAKCPFFRTFYS